MEYLEPSEFASRYNDQWAKCQVEKFKLEVLPEYNEFKVEDWTTVNSAQTSKLISAVQEGVFQWLKDNNQDKRDSRFLRIRYVPFPLTKYLLIELSSYATSQAFGGEVKIIEDFDLKQIQDLKAYFGDFLLFDDKVLFKLDNPGGIVSCGAYYTEDASEIAPYLRLKEKLKQISQPLEMYLKSLNIQFVTSMPDTNRN